MSFRKLVYHAESDCLFEIKSEAEYEDLNENGDGMCDDVTGIEKYEARFIKESFGFED